MACRTFLIPTKFTMGKILFSNLFKFLLRPCIEWITDSWLKYTIKKYFIFQIIFLTWILQLLIFILTEISKIIITLAWKRKHFLVIRLIKSSNFTIRFYDGLPSWLWWFQWSALQSIFILIFYWSILTFNIIPNLKAFLFLSQWRIYTLIFWKTA